MSSITEQISCPICFEIPENEVFQCRNGHNICETCSTSMVRCPQCRVPYSDVKVRNRTVEAIVQSLKVDCPNKANGCTERLIPNSMGAHKNVCVYMLNNVKLCQIIGLNCGLKLNAQNVASTIQHLQMEHGAITQTVSKFCMKLDGFPSHTTGGKEKTWKPHVMKSANCNIVIVVRLKNDMLSCLGVILEVPTVQQKQRMMEFQIKGLANEAIDVVWHSPILSLAEVMRRAAAPPDPIRMDYIRHYSMTAGGSFSINVCITQINAVTNHLIDAAAGGRGHLETVQALCLYPYEAWNEEEITLKKGDIVRVISKDIYYGWWKCEFNGKTGLVPENKLTVVSNSESSKSDTKSANKRTKNIRWVKCKGGKHGTAQNSVMIAYNPLQFPVRAGIPGLKFKVAGCLHKGDTNAVICFRNVAFRVPEYEILCIPEGYWRWTEYKTWGKLIPDDSISTGLIPDGPESYVGNYGGLGSINATEGHFYKVTEMQGDAVGKSTTYNFLLAAKQ